MKNVQQLISILTLRQEDLFRQLLTAYKEYVSGYYEDKFILLKSSNDIKPMLCVHLDTINDASHKAPKQSDFVFNPKDNTIRLSKKSKLSCVGGDDRCGVFIIMTYFYELIQKYHIGFFCDEEVGGIGSEQASKLINDDYSISCFIGLDRKGSDEVATYGYDNEELIEAFVSLGYKEAYGTFTDASNLASTGTVACLNISVGYNNEHTKKEVIHTDVLEKTAQALLNVTLDSLRYEAEKYSRNKLYSRWYDDFMEYEFDSKIDTVKEFSYNELMEQESLGNCICCGTSNHKRRVIECDVLCDNCLEIYF